MTASVVGVVVVFVMSNLLVFVDGGRRLALVSSSSDANLEIATTTVSPNTKTTETNQRTSRTAGWCHIDDIPKTFARKMTNNQDPSSNATVVEFPPLSAITVKCRSQPSLTVRLVCSNASWTTENELDGDKIASKSNRTAAECHQPQSSSSSSQNSLMQMTPKFRTPVSALTGGLMQSSSTPGGGGGSGSGVSVSHRMTSVILCVAFTVFFTTFSLAMKLIMDKYEVRGFLRVGRRSQRSDRQGQQQDGSRRSTSTSHRHTRTRNQARDDPRLTAIATLSGQLNVYRPAHVHVVFTTVVDGGRTSLTVIRPMLPPSALAAPPRQSSSDIVPSYEEALALEQPPPTYEQVTQATHSSSFNAASVGGGTERELSVKLVAN